MRTVLITAYAVNPFKGSEDGTGWNIPREIAKTNRVIVITRKNNIPHIERYVATSDDLILENMTFHGFDLPNWAMRLKKKLGERGYVLYFYFWQVFVARFAKKKRFQFDIAHSLNFHSDSHPNFLWMLGKPTFWGPLGHHPKVPRKYLKPIYGWKNHAKDRVYFITKWIMRNLDPFFYLAVWKSKQIFAINSSVAKAMHASPDKVTLLPAVASETIPELKKNSNEFNVLSVGRFHYMKGYDITIRAFALFYHQLNTDQQETTQLVLVGKGEEKHRLLQIANEEKINHKIRWVDWVEKHEMHAIYNDAHTYLFPSHEGAGMVIPEAMSYALPIICFDNVGPGELAGVHSLKVKYSSYEDSIQQFADHLNHLYTDIGFREDLGNKAHRDYKERFTWKLKGECINKAYDMVSVKQFLSSNIQLEKV